MKFRQLQTEIRPNHIYWVNVNSFDGYKYKGRVKVVHKICDNMPYIKDKYSEQNCPWWKCILLDENDYDFDLNIAECFFKLKKTK